MEITRQADAFGLDQPERTPAPPPEKVAEQLKAPIPWSGPTKVGEALDSEEHHSDPYTGRSDLPGFHQ